MSMGLWIMRGTHVVDHRQAGFAFLWALSLPLQYTARAPVPGSANVEVLITLTQVWGFKDPRVLMVDQSSCLGDVPSDHYAV